MITVFLSEKKNKNKNKKAPLFWDLLVDYGKSPRHSILIPFISGDETRIQQYTSFRRPSIYFKNANLVLNDLKMYLPMNKCHDYCTLSFGFQPHKKGLKTTLTVAEIRGSVTRPSQGKLISWQTRVGKLKLVCVNGTNSRQNTLANCW